MEFSEMFKTAMSEWTISTVPKTSLANSWFGHFNNNCEVDTDINQRIH